jgi:glycosyltransferase involved in cell wall biosynthesis
MRLPPAHSRGSRRVLVIGSGTRFISGVSHYTRYMAVALAERATVSVILMRRLIPRVLYPGRARVGMQLTDAAYPADVPVFDGVDWYWIPSMLGALRLMRRERPQVLVFQWWTGAVLHSYLLLALAGRLLGARVIVELHEIQDTGEAGMASARSYVALLGRWFMGMSDGFLVHSEFDREALAESFGSDRRPVRVVRHGPYSHYAVDSSEPLRDAPAGACNFLYFGTIRPYKGLEDLVRAFESLIETDPEGEYWLTVVGETWEGWTEPAELIARSRHRRLITLVNHYVSDAEAASWFAGADVVALPYRRSSASGPLHMAIGAGLPVVVGDVGGLREAATVYPGAVLVPAADIDALRRALGDASRMRGTRYEDGGSWSESAEAVLGLLEELDEKG